MAGKLKPCPIHGKPPILVYPCCVGAKGGQAIGAAKAASSRANLEKARLVKQAGKPPPEAPGTSGTPVPGVV